MFCNVDHYFTFLFTRQIFNNKYIAFDGSVSLCLQSSHVGFVCVCVCMRERERHYEKESVRVCLCLRECVRVAFGLWWFMVNLVFCVCLCVLEGLPCVCVRQSVCFYSLCVCVLRLFLYVFEMVYGEYCIVHVLHGVCTVCPLVCMCVLRLCLYVFVMV